MVGRLVFRLRYRLILNTGLSFRRFIRFIVCFTIIKLLYCANRKLPLVLLKQGMLNIIFNQYRVVTYYHSVMQSIEKISQSLKLFKHQANSFIDSLGNDKKQRKVELPRPPSQHQALTQPKPQRKFRFQSDLEQRALQKEVQAQLQRGVKIGEHNSRKYELVFSSLGPKYFGWGQGPKMRPQQILCRRLTKLEQRNKQLDEERDRITTKTINQKFKL